MKTGATTISEESIQAALARLLESRTFSRSQQLCRFLELTVSWTLAGRQDELKEYAIAIEACGRREDHDPRIDAIVRTEAQRLRQKLVKYYDGEGADDAVQISYPKGSYVPVFSHNTHSVAAEETKAGLRTKPFWKSVAAAVIAVAAGAFALAGHALDQPGSSVAVLLFDDLSQDRSHDTFALATTEALMVRLAREPGIDLLSPTATSSAPSRPAYDPSADYVVQGSVQRAGQSSRVMVRLIRADDDKNVWAESYTFDGATIFEVQDSVAEDVAVRLGGIVMPRGTNPPIPRFTAPKRESKLIR